LISSQRYTDETSSLHVTALHSRSRSPNQNRIKFQSSDSARPTQTSHGQPRLVTSRNEENFQPTSSYHKLTQATPGSTNVNFWKLLECDFPQTGSTER